ncbi:cellobiose dehydrogenase [Cordyceps fumosorosea ARSEF 2679]|uniref:Cellobiose dehydrogenase n=1 Tax=Cordyceps fumosorosea (strain ARSEF 2679) TaxID=1081104 RepID=A0A162N034_CORFA|nr:cellobiose dehydrogenase [Cordyceps fumosorosea ARSEF 2679]OAA73359.1 cellobiose dehydrogenase [Cordyceps fumosorosea ARSEF 2679]
MKYSHTILLAALASASPTPKDWTLQKWDAIVVGAGTSGIIVADRLSEAGLNTLLLEQGGPSYGISGGTERPAWLNGTELSRVDVPGLYSTIFDSPNSSLLCKPDAVRAYQACTLGGNSAINAGLYFQPPSSDWDDHHPPGWRSADVRAATERLLQRQPPVTNYSADGRTYVEDIQAAAHTWLVDGAGFAEVDFGAEPDRKDRVYGRPVYNYIDGQRGGPVRTYLQSALSRPNFHLATGVRVKHVIHENGTASGVEVEDGCASRSVGLAPGGRVVLSAGALQSPQLLMHSGIGPRETLQRLSDASFGAYAAPSSWVVQPAVGEGLFDNPNTFIELSSPAITSFAYRYEDPDPAGRDLYLDARSGRYSFASQAAAFWTYVPHEDGSRSGVQGTISSAGYADYTGAHTVTLNVYGTSGLLSAGRVELSSDGRFVAGASADTYYSHPRDARAVAAFVHDIFQALPASTPERPAAEGLTPLNIARTATVEEIERYVTTASAYARGQVNHWSSSCRIGACVDADTRVVGTENVHVVDASIISPMTVNPQFAVMVAGEKGAERILALAGKGL